MQAGVSISATQGDAPKGPEANSLGSEGEGEGSCGGGAATFERVKVALRVRPLVALEEGEGSASCVRLAHPPPARQSASPPVRHW